ncbi:proton-coupled folate transporter [Trichonephila clavipes]|nr:proton-coupled folate transporter [Trichonephila clavipes]
MSVSLPIGKVFSFVATAEALLPVLTTIIISQIFNAFLDIFPGMPYIVLAICLIIPFAIFIWMKCLPAVNPAEGNLKDEKDQDSYSRIT